MFRRKKYLYSKELPEEFVRPRSVILKRGRSDFPAYITDASNLRSDRELVLEKDSEEPKLWHRTIGLRRETSFDFRFSLQVSDMRL